jgi:hypothetical protein
MSKSKNEYYEAMKKSKDSPYKMKDTLLTIVKVIVFCIVAIVITFIVYVFISKMFKMIPSYNLWIYKLYLIWTNMS